MTEKIPGWLERVLLPKLSEMTGEIKAINVRIDAVDEKLGTKIDEMDRRLSANDKHLAEKIEAVDQRLGTKIDDLDKRLDMAQRLAILETKMSELQPKA